MGVCLQLGVPNKWAVSRVNQAQGIGDKVPGNQRCSEGLLYGEFEESSTHL